MKKSLRSSLSLSYILLVLLCVLLISYLANFFLQEHFNKYIVKEHEKTSREIVDSIEHQFEAGMWDKKTVESIGIDALEEGLLISVKDINNNVIWDAFSYDDEECRAVINKLSHNMVSRYPNWKGQLVKSQYTLKSQENKIGFIEIQNYGPFYYNDNDVLYLKTLNRVLVVVGITSLIIALTIGLIMAKSLSLPISKVINAAEMISKGNYTKKIDKTSSIDEINRLIKTINNLGHSLNEQENLRKRLTRDVSHELRTPLTTLQSNLEALIDGIWEPTEDRLKNCHDEVLRLSRLVGDLEELALYESENLVLEKSEYNLSQSINNVIMNYKKEFMSKGIKLTYNSQNEEIYLYADKDKISQVIKKLLSNAAKYTEKDGRVEVKLDQDAQFVYISIKDTGIGISEEHVPFIFERFYRADKSRNRSTGGAGIGLTIAKSIVESHDGIISVKSKIKAGTEFLVKIPKK